MRADNSNSPAAWPVIKNAILTLLTRRPLVRHKKTGGWYTVVGKARIQSDVPLEDMAEVVIYQAKDGTLWARRAVEFADGRFDIGVRDDA